MTSLVALTVNGDNVVPALKVQIFKMPESIELSAVTTAGHYILASHLVRSLTKVDKFGKIQSDIVKKWKHSPDHKSWQLWIGEEKFSNGDLITAGDVVSSIKRQTDLGTGVHFPFTDIAKVELKNDNSVKVELKTPRVDFIYDLSKPEFGVLHKSEVSAKKGQLKFAISSGPYFLTQKIGNTHYLKKNKFFTSDVKNDLDLVMENSDGIESPAALTVGNIDFFSTQQNLTLAAHSELSRTKNLTAVKPHIAFSYWLSVNPESAHFKTKENRARLQMLVKNFKGSSMDEHVWQKAYQLYLPDGDGRPSAQQLEAVWSAIKAKASKIKSKTASKSKLKVVPLKVTNTLTAELLESLKSDYEIEIIQYKTEDELIAILAEGNFDIKVSSNDFSSIDLSENLKTTFNASRPYVFLEKSSPVKEMMKKASLDTEKAKKSEIFMKIGLNLLTEGLIAPLAYQRVWFYHKTKLDISAWSSISPEISMWKVSIHD